MAMDVTHPMTKAKTKFPARRMVKRTTRALVFSQPQNRGNRFLADQQIPLDFFEIIKSGTEEDKAVVKKKAAAVAG